MTAAVLLRSGKLRERQDLCYGLLLLQERKTSRRAEVPEELVESVFVVLPHIDLDVPASRMIVVTLHSFDPPETRGVVHAECRSKLRHELPGVSLGDNYIQRDVAREDHHVMPFRHIILLHTACVVQYLSRL